MTWKTLAQQDLSLAAMFVKARSRGTQGNMLIWTITPVPKICKSESWSLTCFAPINSRITEKKSNFYLFIFNLVNHLLVHGADRRPLCFKKELVNWTWKMCNKYWCRSRQFRWMRGKGWGRKLSVILEETVCEMKAGHGMRGRRCGRKMRVCLCPTPVFCFYRSCQRGAWTHWHWGSKQSPPRAVTDSYTPIHSRQSF